MNTYPFKTKDEIIKLVAKFGVPMSADEYFQLLEKGAVIVHTAKLIFNFSNNVLTINLK